MDVAKPAREGELYRVISLHGKSFHIYYGYYDDRERSSKYNDPIPIYPDFIKEPQYTDDGVPFATAIQDVCELYDGASPDDGCNGCVYFRRGEEFLGLCTCGSKRKK